MQGSPTFLTGPMGLALLATATQAEALAAIGISAITTGNRLINGGMAIDQFNLGGAQTITAGAALAITVDRWLAYCTGANVQGQRVQGATAGQFRYQFTGASGCTGIGFGQRIEQLNSADLAGTTATLSVDLANSLLTSVTWTAYYANTANTFGTLASPTRTQIATGTFTVSATVARYSVQIDIPIEAVTGIEIVFTVGAQTAETWVIGDVQLEKGSIATPFQFRHEGLERALCYRYRTVWINRVLQTTPAPIGIGSISLSTVSAVMVPNPVPLRTTPVVNFFNLVITDNFSFEAAVSNITVGSGNEITYYLSAFHASAPLGGGSYVQMRGPNNSSLSYLIFSAEL